MVIAELRWSRDGVMLISMTASALEQASCAVRGQHRNKALAQYRKARAVELAILGKSYDEIAAEVGFTHRGTAYKTVQRALAESLAEGVDQLRRLEVDRLDALQESVWDRAMGGDCAAVAVVQSIISQR